MTDNATQRASLAATVAADQRELDAALGELRHAVTQPMAIVDEVAAHLARHPVGTLLAALAAGIWLGRR